jgi:hypothetical protein
MQNFKNIKCHGVDAFSEEDQKSKAYMESIQSNNCRFFKIS